MHNQLTLPLPTTTSRYCQRWRNHRPSWRWADLSERFDAHRYEVHPLSETAARQYVVRHHYSTSYPSARFRYGMHRAGRLVGVAVFSVPVQRKVLTTVLPDLDPYRESLELGRFVLDDEEPGNAESWFLARCFNDFLYPAGVRGVVSFADPVPRANAAGTVVLPGHVGWIYQASNGVYTGRGTPRTQWLLPTGQVLSPRAMQKIRKQESGHEYAERLLVRLGARPPRPGQRPAEWLTQALHDANARRFRHPGCHRYVFPLGTNRRQRQKVTIAPPAQPYPKQAHLRVPSLEAGRTDQTHKR